MELHQWEPYDVASSSLALNKMKVIIDTLVFMV